MQISTRKRKATAQEVPPPKKLRSKIPRRKRFHISPIFTATGTSLSLLPQPHLHTKLHHPDPDSSSSVFQATSSSSSCFPITSLPLRSDSLVSKRQSLRRKRDSDPDPDRPVTRSYLKQKQLLESEVTAGVELSESSCVESSSLVDIPLLNNSSDKILSKQAQIQLVSLSEASCVQNVCEFVPENSPEVVQPMISVSQVQNPNFDNDLACSEHISVVEYSDDSTSSELTLSDLESEFFPRNSVSDDHQEEEEYLSSDFSPSHLFDSLSEFSESSDSTPPAYFPLFLEYARQLGESNTFPLRIGADSSKQDKDGFTLMRFEEEENEESYKKFRWREKKILVYDYVDEYCSTTEFGDLVIEQRLLMVNWMVEQSSVRELQNETVFLGVSLLDRFLTQGFFRNKRKLQLLGIACLTLATRIEENQPYNCVRQRTFNVDNDKYSRCEVIAMEWLVQKVLNFKCFVPTTYNFLWFYLKAARADDETEKRAKYLALLSLLDHEILCYWPSTVAAGLVILASLAANQEPSCQWVMETHVRTKDDDLPECIQSLEWLVKYVC